MAFTLKLKSRQTLVFIRGHYQRQCRLHAKSAKISTKSYASDLDESEGFWHQGTSADLLKSAEKGCGSCRLLLQGIRKFKSDWGTFDEKARNWVDFRFYGKGEGIDLSVLFRARVIDEDGSERDRLSETLLEFYQLRGEYSLLYSSYS